MIRNIAIGIDIGSFATKIVVAEHSTKNSLPRVIGVGISESKGIRHGYVVNHEEAIESLKKALAQAEKSSGVEIKKAYVSIGGIGVSSMISQASTIVSRADSEVTDMDVEKVQDICEHDLPQQVSLNREVIHAIPLAFRIDGKPIMGRPQGMKGSKLEVRMLFVLALKQHLEDFKQVINEAGVEIEKYTAGPIASSLVSLSKAQKIAGAILANIGAETLSIVVFESNIPQSLETFPIGSNDITNDIALNLRISLEEAEKVKCGDEEDYPRKKLEDIMGTRFDDMFQIIDEHLKKINRSGLLPAGIVICGGGASANHVEQYAKNTLKLPARIAQLSVETSMKIAFKDPIWSVAYGLCVLGLENNMKGPEDSSNGIKKKIINWIKQFLP